MSQQTFATPKEVLSAWIQAVNTLNIDALMAMYSADHILLPTFSPHMIRDDAATLQYFQQLGTRKGLSVRLHERTLTEQALTANCSVLSGIYTWTFEVDDEPLSFASRFTYVIDLAEEQPIRHHHSSQIPRTLS